MQITKTRNKVASARRIRANSEVAPEATELLFEAEDVAQLVAEITGEEVSVEADGTTATFEVGEEAFTVEAEEGDEVVESSTRVLRGKRPVKANRSTRPMNGRSAKTCRRIK